MPSLTMPNIHDRAAVVGGARPGASIAGRPAAADRPGRFRIRWRRCRSSASSRCRRAAQDLDQLVRWQVRKTAPFPIDEAQVSYVPGAAPPTGRSSSSSLARRDIDRGIRERLRGGRRARRARRLWRPSTSSTRCWPAGRRPRGDWLLVNVAAGLRLDRDPARRDLIFFRSRGADSRRHAGRSGAPDGDVLRGSAAAAAGSAGCCWPARAAAAAAGGRRRADSPQPRGAAGGRRWRPSIRATAAA